MRRFVSVFVLLAACGSWSSHVVADEDHGIGKIVTDELDLTYIDHVLTGRVGDRPIYAAPLADEFGMLLMHRAGGIDFESTFRSVDGEYVATVGSMSTDGEESATDFRVTSVSAAEGEIKGFLNGRPFTVRISADEMNGNHYVNPAFAIDVDGTPYSFVLDGGQACIACALKITFAVLSMLSAYGTL